MNIKKIKLLAILGIFLISFPCHFIYDLCPNFLTSIFFPVNESIWEHMKIIFTSTILYSLIDYTLLKRNNLPLHNFKYQLFITPIIGLISYLIIYLPIYHFLGEILPLSIILLLIIYILEQIISYYILISNHNQLLNLISIPIIIIIYLLFTYLTYYPPKFYLFYDTLNKTYSLPNK